MSHIEKIHVLIVDDSVTMRNIITKHLGESFVAVHASNGQEAWQLIQSNPAISLVFADLHMPVMNGMMLLKQIRVSDCEHISNLPVIMITGHEDTDAAKRASYNMGATDFISKPFSELDIISRVSSYTKLNQKITALEQNVNHDSLTQLFNKRGLQEIGDKAVAGAHRHQFALSICTMQIANVDALLSKHGEKVSEQIIVSVANNLKKSLRKEDTLAHLGSGRFVLLLPMTNAFRAHIVAIRFQKAVDNLAFQMPDEVIRIKLAAGLNSTEAYKQEVTFTELSAQAEKALQESLQHWTCKVTVHNETLISKEPQVEHNKFSSDSEQQESAGNELTVDLQKLDTTIFSRYMAAILNGDFDAVPAQHIGSMVKPLESFLDFAYEHIQTDLENSKKKA